MIKMFTSGKSQINRYSKMPSLMMILIAIIAMLVHSTNCDDDHTEDLKAMDRLRSQLFVNYDKTSQPTLNGVLTDIRLSLSANYVDIDELNSKMTLHCWVKIWWHDEKRSWNPKDYDNITNLHFRPKEVWRPDISLFNSAGEGASYVGDTQILLNQKGEFLWVPPAVYTAYCNLNLQMWPYDTQTCKLKVGSWTLTRIDSSVSKLEEGLDYFNQIKSTEWEVIDGNSEYFEKDFYNYLEFTFVLKRRASMYGAVIFTPASCIVLLTLSTFWLPPQMGEKIMINGVIIVIIAAFLMYFAQLLPILAENTPLVVHFYSISLLFVSIATIIAVLVLYLSTAKHKRRVPDFLRNLLNGHLGWILCLNHFSPESDTSALLQNSNKEMLENVYDSAEGNDIPNPCSINPTEEPFCRSIQFDWILLATAVDRICFLIYSLLFIILAICYSV